LNTANLAGASLERADLRGAELQDAGLEEACLEEADLSAASLEGARFEGADVKAVRAYGVDLSAARLDDAQRRAITGGLHRRPEPGNAAFGHAAVAPFDEEEDGEPPSERSGGLLAGTTSPNIGNGSANGSDQGA
jgi:hypothetical protein